jgi:eukaryotic-like serine/threonine-protein kinase
VTAQRWAEIEQVYYGALACEADQRGAFLDRHCSDENMRREVESLLAANDQAGSFLGPESLRAQVRELAAEQVSYSEGSWLSHYRILSRIGEGGMGVVYAALDTKLERRVALKLLQPEFARD